MPHALKQEQRADLHLEAMSSPKGRAGSQQPAGAQSAGDQEGGSTQQKQVRGKRPREGRAQALPGQATCRRPPEVTYSSRGSQLLAALARGIQIDIFTLTSFLTGVFTLGETGREERHMGQALQPALTAGQRTPRPALCSPQVQRAKLLLPPLASVLERTQVSCSCFSNGVRG